MATSEQMSVGHINVGLLFTAQKPKMQITLSLSNFSIKTQNRQGGKNDENLHSHCQKEQLCILRHYIMKKNLFSFQDSNSLKEKKFPFNCNNHFVLKTLDILHFKVVLHKRPSSIYKNYKQHLHQKTKSTEKKQSQFLSQCVS